MDDDLDNDGYLLTDDCDDNNPDINPNVEEVVYNGLDDDCDPLTLDDDLDNDGFLLTEDCDDHNPNINPNMEEVVYNGLDDDCNPLTLDDDLDNDGFLLSEDCDDHNPDINPNASEIPDNGIDENCDGLDLTTSSTDLNGFKVSIFPNPTSKLINIRTNTSLTFETKFYNLAGKLVYSQNGQSLIDITNLDDGIYFLEIKETKSQQKTIEKIIVAK